MSKGKTHTRITVFFLIVTVVFAAGCMRAEKPERAALTVPGIVTDEAGRALAEVNYRISAVRAFRDGSWGGRTGWPTDVFTDRKGRFVLVFHEANVRYDLQFSKFGYAPSFLYDISPDSEELKVVMKRGVSFCGTVTRLVDGERRPVPWTTVTLRLPAIGGWYQKRTITDMKGEYTFRVSPPPRDFKWQVVFEDEIVEVDVKEGQPVEGVDFEIEVTAKR